MKIQNRGNNTYVLQENTGSNGLVVQIKPQKNSCQYPSINYLEHTQGFFMKHFKKHHGGFPPGFEDAKIYICDQCPEEFLTPYNLANHKSSVHKFLSQKFICDKCDTG